jgi:hypothetical protein
MNGATRRSRSSNMSNLSSHLISIPTPSLPCRKPISYRMHRNQVEPQARTIRKLAEALGVEPHELLKGDDGG